MIVENRLVRITAWGHVFFENHFKSSANVIQNIMPAIENCEMDG